MSYIYDLTDTWNAAGTVFTSIKMNVTDSASANGSKLIDLQIAGTSFFNVDKSGAVGIGTSAPSGKLDIRGAGGAVAFQIQRDASSVLQIYQGSGINYFDTAAAGQYAFLIGTTERMRLTAAGSLGIGTSTPVARLEVNGTQRISKAGAGYEPAMLSFSTLTETGAIYRIGMGTAGSFTIGRSDTSTTNITLTQAGNVGIGTTSPTSPLDVQASTGVIKLTSTTGTAAVYTALNNTGGDLYFGRENSAGTALGYPAYSSFIHSVGAYPLIFAANNNERMRITATGDVGIGTSSPTAKLDVNGQLNVPDQLAYDFTTSVLPDIAPTLNLNFVGANAVDPRITFTRSTTATYYDAETTALAEQNLFLYSQEFDDFNWVKDNSTVTANATTAPDGTSTADKFIASATTGFHSVYYNISLTAGQHTVSFYIKASEYSLARIAEGVSGRAYASFDLSTGTVVGGSTGGTQFVSASVVSAGSGWYRCIMVITATTGGYAFGVLGYPSSGATLNPYGASYTGDGTSGVFIWGAQLEQRSTVTAYTATTASPITNYIPQLMTAAINQPRLDFDPTTRAPKGLLIEEARTNLCLYSQQFDDGAWSKARVSVTANAQIAPDGTLTADVVTANVGTSDSISQGPTLAAAVHTVSIYLKGTASSTQVTLGLFSGGFLAATGQVLLGPGTISGSGLMSVAGLSTTQWTRVSFTTTSATPAGSIPLLIYPGGGGAANASIVMWGAQIEAGAFATSYIPTVATTVQRTSDVASMTGTNFSSWCNQGEGTITLEGTIFGLGVTTASGLAALSNGTPNENTGLFRSGGVNNINAAMRSVNAAQATYVLALGSQPFKMAFAYAANNTNFAQNGVVQATDTACVVPTVDRFIIGSVYAAGDYPTNGHIRSIRYYPARLSNATLQALTA